MPKFQPCFRCLLLALLLCCVRAAQALGPGELALIVNASDPASVEAAAYYRLKRGIPESNVIEVKFAHDRNALSREEFERVQSEVTARLPPQVKALALAWTRPWRDGCMSITSAFAFG